MTAGRVLSPAVQGALWMLFSGLCYVISVTVLRDLGGAYSAFEITFIRSIVACLMLAPMFFRARVGSFWPDRPGTILLASVLIYLAIYLWLTGAAKMPVADFFAIQFTTPLITIVMAIVFLRERPDAASWIATFVGFAGVLIVVRPGFVAVSVGVAAALASCFAYASVNTCVKSLSGTVSATAIVFYTSLLMIPISLPMAVAEWKTPLPADWPAILAVCFFSTLGYTSISKSISLAPARVVQPVNFMRMPVAALVGLAVFGEFPDLWTWVGAFVIFLSTSYTVQRGARH
jgi:drug/metabolite transporter (DMT)-like permease